MIEGLVVREFSPMSSNWRSTEVADEYLERNGIPVIGEVDTRAVVRHLRANGVMRGVMASGMALNEAELVAKARAIRRMDGTDLASVVSTKAAYAWSASEPKNQTEDKLLKQTASGDEMHVVAYDFGIKDNILRMLAREGCRVTVVPATTSAADVLAMQPDGVSFQTGRAIRSRWTMPLQMCGSSRARRRCSGFAWPPNLRAGAWGQDVQAEVRASRGEPPDHEP